MLLSVAAIRISDFQNFRFSYTPPTPPEFCRLGPGGAGNVLNEREPGSLECAHINNELMSRMEP